MEADEDLEQELKAYPTSFELIENTGKMTAKYLKLKLEQSIKDLDILSTKMEECRTHNLISFLHFVIGDTDLAFEANKKTLELEPDNIIALSNHAQFLFRQEQHFDTVRHNCGKLSELCKDPYKKIIAKAEIAFSYTRFGSRFCKIARPLFQRVLSDCKELADDVKLTKEFEDNICIWSFGCALTYKRLLNIVNVHDTSDIDLSKRNYRSVCELYRNIIAMGGHSDICKLYTARAYLLLGEISYDLERKIFPNKLRDILPENKNLHMEVGDYFQMALSLQKNDVFVLERCGKHFRYTNQISKSIELLQKAITIKQTSLSHQHLAISLKRQLEFKSKPGHQLNKATRQLFPKPPADERQLVTWNSQAALVKSEEGTRRKDVDSASMPRRNDGEVLGRLTNQFAELSMSDHTENLSEAARSIPRQHEPAHQSGDFTYSHNGHNRNRGRGNGRKYGGRGHRFSLQGSKCSFESGYGRGIGPCRGQMERGFSDPTGREKAAYRRCIKSPRKCTYITTIGNEVELKSIEFHLDTSFKIGMNVSAMYEKGLLFRQLNKIDDALNIFRRLIRNEYGQCTLVLLANAYEQAGLCLDDLLCKSHSDNQKRDEEDMKMYFKKSIEISCNLVAKIPSLEKCWTSFPTLKAFLNRQSKTKHVLKDLKFLYEKMKYYGEVVQVLNELWKLVEDNAEKTKLIMDMIKTHMLMKNFDDAVLGFDLIKCLPKWQQLVDKELYITAHVEGAFDAFKKDHNQVTNLRFENAFGFCKSMSNQEPKDATREDEENEESEGAQYDIFILSDPDNELNGMKLRHVLETLGIKTTLNTEDVPRGTLNLKGLPDIIELSKHFIVVYDNKSSEKGCSRKLQYYFAIMNDIILSRNHGNGIIMHLANLEVPKIFSGWKQMSFDFDFEHDAMIKDCDILKPFLISLAIGSD